MNAELIKALREAKKHFWTQPQIELYPMMEAAADALEAADKRIAELERILKAVQENSGINFRMWQEAEAQLPKEGECDAANVNGNQSDEDKAVMDCSYCPSADGCLEAFSESTLCPRVTGEQMRGEHDE